MYKTKYGFVENSDSRVYHIVKGLYNYDTKFFKREEVLCNYNKVLNKEIFQNTVYSENEIRERAAQLQNISNYDICGNCIRELYSKKH